MFDWLYDYFWWLFIPLMALLIALVVWAPVIDERNWQAYAIAHHCIPAGKVAASTAPGWGVNVKGQFTYSTIYIPEKTIYKCDGDEIEIR